MAKNNVRIESMRVVKRFNHGHHRRRRFCRENRALHRLRHVEGIPQVLASQPAERRLVLERIHGQAFAQAPKVPDRFYHQLHILVEQMLEQGVARHSMPPRDVIVRSDGSPGLVDYERVTLRHWRFSPVWLVARTVTRFHLLRFVGDHAPQLLDAVQKRRLARQRRIRTHFRRWLEWRRRQRLLR